MNETKSWFFEKINEIDKSLVKLTKRKRGEIQDGKLEGGCILCHSRTWNSSNGNTVSL